MAWTSTTSRTIVFHFEIVFVIPDSSDAIKEVTSAVEWFPLKLQTTLRRSPSVRMPRRFRIGIGQDENITF